MKKILIAFLGLLTFQLTNAQQPSVEKELYSYEMDDVHDVEDNVFEHGGKEIEPRNDNERLIKVDMFLGIAFDEVGDDWIPVKRSLKVPMEEMLLTDMETTWSPLLLFNQETEQTYRKNVYKVSWGSDLMDKYVTLVYSVPKDKFPIRMRIGKQDFSLLLGALNTLDYPIEEEKLVDRYMDKDMRTKEVSWVEFYRVSEDQWLEKYFNSSRILNYESVISKESHYSPSHLKYYYPNGNLWKEFTWDEYVNLDGLFTTYFSNGKKQKIEYYIHGELEKVVAEWDENGRQIIDNPIED